jgi:glutamate carboxypeptidase
VTFLRQSLPLRVPQRRSFRTSVFGFLLSLLVFTSAPRLYAQQLSPQQSSIVRSIDADAPAAVALLEQLVNINSGTFNPSGVSQVAQILDAEFQTLGFTTHSIPMDSVHRAPSLLAEHHGTRGQRILLLGHMDTVFEPSSPFQKFERTGDTAVGPGIGDMKGGIVVILSALKALKRAGALNDARISVFLTGDEESAGEPVEASRKDLIAAAKNSDAVLSFEPEISQNGKDYAVTARRGATFWELRTTGKAGHSSQIFTNASGDGAIFELSRILAQFHDTLREPNMTYNVGMLLGGSDPKIDPSGAGSVTGKVNIIPGEAVAIGDIRALYPDQLARIEQKMQVLVAPNLPGTSATIRFVEKYPPMAPTPGNNALLEKLNVVNRALGAPLTEAVDPMSRGAGDASFAAPYAPVLDGLGAPGQGAHAPGESVDLSRLPLQSKTTALLLHALTH